jgi:broad specificity phosphatase PhoE
MTRILLIRHAETDPMLHKLCGRTEGISLNATGKANAARLGAALRAESLEGVYSSPLERALETAHHIRGQAQVEDRFTELDFGEWTGKTFTELQTIAQWHEHNQCRSKVTPPGGEAPMQVLRRAAEALEETARRHAGGKVAVVTHADVIRSLLTRLLGMSLDDLLRFEIAPASVSEVSLGGRCPVLHYLNRTFPQQNSSL